MFYNVQHQFVYVECPEIDVDVTKVNLSSTNGEYSLSISSYHFGKNDYSYCEIDYPMLQSDYYSTFEQRLWFCWTKEYFQRSLSNQMTSIEQMISMSIIMINSLFQTIISK